MTTIIFSQNAHQALVRASLGSLPITLMAAGEVDVSRVVSGEELVDEIKAVPRDETLVLVIVDAQQAKKLEEIVSQLRRPDNTEIVRLRVGFQATPAPSVSYAAIIAPEDAEQYLLSVLEKHRSGVSRQEAVVAPQESPAEAVEEVPASVAVPSEREREREQKPLWKRLLPHREKKGQQQDKTNGGHDFSPMSLGEEKDAFPSPSEAPTIPSSSPLPSPSPKPPSDSPSMPLPSSPLSEPAAGGKERVRTIVVRQAAIKVVATPGEIEQAQKLLQRRYGDAIRLIPTTLRDLASFFGEKTIVVLGIRNICEFVPIPNVHIILADDGDLTRWLPILPEKPPAILVSPRKVAREIARIAELIALGEGD